MLIEGWLSLNNGWSKEDQKKLEELVLSVFGKIDLEVTTIDQIIALMGMDKKNQNQNINFTLLKSPGQATINHYLDKNLIEKSLKYYLSL
jgi:3-dehydroquinate synthetase